MQLTFLTALTLLSPVLGLAIPSNTTDTTLSARGNTPYGIYVCSKPKWEGECYHVRMPARKCYNFKALAGKVNSFGPDMGLNCFLYANTDCAGLDVELMYPGLDYFGGIGWSDRIKSAICLNMP